MARHETALTTMQARTILSQIKRYAKPITTKDDIKKVGILAAKLCMRDYAKDFPKENGKLFYAFALSATARHAVKVGTLKVLDYVSFLAETKENNEKEINDFGAFGDLYEILVRCAFMRSLSLVNWTTLAVKPIKEVDIDSKKFGLIEVGHNGKTLTQGTLIDYMEGEYTAVVYGTFSEEDKAKVYEYCKNKELKNAVEYIAQYSGYWSDKYAFQNDMDNLTTGKGITKKGNDIQVVYNAGKYKAFQNALSNGLLPSLYEIIKNK